MNDLSEMFDDSERPSGRSFYFDMRIDSFCRVRLQLTYLFRLQSLLPGDREALITMQRTYFKTGLVWCVILMLSACGLKDAKTPEEWFKFSWAGLAGCDSLTFRGSAAIFRGENSKMEDAVNFTGKLKDHHQLAIQTTLPSSTGNNGGTDGVQAAGTHLNTVYKAELQWNEGSWNLKSNKTDVNNLGIARLNPLDQLEEIRSQKKTINVESGAARGTKVLRIELDPKESAQRLQAKLADEMEAVKAGWEEQLLKVKAERRPKVKLELEQVWSEGRDQLMTMLNQADARVVYHLTINRNSGLPIRLSSETELSYINASGSHETEVLRTDSRFEQFR